MNALPGRLLAADPGWTLRSDVVVVGSGIAGLSVALNLRASGHTVIVVTKVDIDAGSTRWAQGGIAAVQSPDDSPERHLQDTLVAGVGLCDEDAVRVLVTEGPGRLAQLVARGALFDRGPDGAVELTREGGHRRNRIVHAGGDATGAEVQRALAAAVRRDAGIRVVEHALVLDLLTTADGRAAGVTLHVLGEGRPDGVGAVLARAVVLATGGMGQIFAATTNPSVSTGDGVALALRAGAVVTDLEFVQFHPTSLYLPPDVTAAGTPETSGAETTGPEATTVGPVGEIQVPRRGQQPLVSEALRGEGAVLVDGDGKRFMADVHELADLAPRDVVAKAITRVMHAEGSPNVWLDARGLGEETLLRRFPSIVARCRAAGIDPVTDPIPVTPAAHYASGGVRTDLDGRTSVPGLYACGEVACTGVHGANRLASNSLLEGLVFAGRIGADIARGLPAQGDPAVEAGGAVSAVGAVGAGRAVVAAGTGQTVRAAGLLAPDVADEVAVTMSRGAGIIRSAASLDMTLSVLDSLFERSSRDSCPETWEATNLHTVATALAGAAAAREETRGSHWREDFPVTDDAGWRAHLLTVMQPDGTLAQTREAAS